MAEISWRYLFFRLMLHNPRTRKFEIFARGRDDNPNTLTDDEFGDLQYAVEAGDRFLVVLTVQDGKSGLLATRELFWNNAFMTPNDLSPYSGMTLVERNSSRANTFHRLLVDGAVWTQDDIAEMFRGGEIIAWGSDMEMIVHIIDGLESVSRFQVIKLLLETSDVKRRRPMMLADSGGSCSILNDTELDLSPIQVYKETDEVNGKHCVRFAFERFAEESRSVLPPNFMNNFNSLMVKLVAGENAKFSREWFPKLGKAMGINIEYRYYVQTKNGGSQAKMVVYPKETSKDKTKVVVPIGHWKDHFFLNSSTKWTANELNSSYGDAKVRLTRIERGNKISYLQVLNILSKYGKLTQLRRMAAMTNSRMVTKARLNEESILRRNFDAINVEDQGQCRLRKVNGRVDQSIYFYCGDIESCVGVGGRSPIDPVTTTDGEPIQERVMGLERHTLYMTGFAPLDAADIKEVGVQRKWGEVERHLIDIHSDEALRKHDARKESKHGEGGGWTVEIIFYFHNLRYDKSIIQNNTHVTSVLAKGSTIYDMVVLLPARDEADRRYRAMTEMGFATAGLRPGRSVDGLIKIRFQDSLKHLLVGIANVPKAFGLPDWLVKKSGAIYYSFFRPETVDIQCTVEQYLTYRPIDQESGNYVQTVGEALTDLEIIMRESGQWVGSRPVTLKDVLTPDNLLIYYLKFDVLIMCFGLRAYRDATATMCEEHLSLEPFDVLERRTISSVSMRIMELSGVFNNTIEYSGVLREYIMRSVRGGRCTYHEATVGKVIQPIGGIADLDATSLYPSAIVQMGCVPCGKPMKLQPHQLDIEWVNKNSAAAVVTVELLRCRKKFIYSIPIVAKVREDGVIDYVQDDHHFPFVTTLNLVELNEYVRLHDVEFKIIYGIFWTPSAGDHARWGELILRLHEARKKAKASFAATGDEKFNLLQKSIKNTMNSQYGKSIMKATTSVLKVLPFNNELQRDNAWAFIYNHWNELKGVPQFTDFDCVLELRTPDESFTTPLHGSTCLAVSRRIMNDVLLACERVAAYVYYTDTDSLMISRAKVKNVVMEYDRRRPAGLNKMIGEDLGQFHSDYNQNDFSIFRNGSVTQGVKQFPSDAKSDDIYGEFLIVVRKKLYALGLTVTAADGRTVKGLTVRAKGATQSGLFDFAYRHRALIDTPTLYSSEYKSLDAFSDPVQRALVAMYYRMAVNGETFSVPLNPGGRSQFKFSRSGVTTSDELFRRRLGPPVRQRVDTDEDQPLQIKRKRYEMKVLTIVFFVICIGRHHVRMSLLIFSRLMWRPMI